VKKTVGEWAAHIGRTVNVSRLAAQAGESVAIVVCGPGALAFIEALRSAGRERDGSILHAASVEEAHRIAGGSLAGIVYSAQESANGAQVPEHGRDPAVFVACPVELPQLRKQLLPDIVKAMRPHEVALGAAIPAFRPAVAASLTHDCAMTCLKIAAASAVADHIPVLGFLTGSIASAGDTIALTALQMRMLLRIAAAYGKRPTPARLAELLPVVGGGFVWRTIAREASGFIPIAGIPIKAAIAYAGTLVVGQVAAHYYETGLHMPSSAMRAAYRAAAERAQRLIRR
jgi:uncharacterized protein (DUF697 family)